MSIIVFCCLSSLALLPFFSPLEFHDSQRILSILLATALVIGRIWHAEWTRHTLVVLLTLTTLGIASVSLSPAPLWSGTEFALLFTVFLLPVILFRHVDEAGLQQIAMAMMLIQAGYVSRDLWNYREILLNGYPLHAVTIIDGFSNMRFYGQFLVWTVPFSLGALANSTIKRGHVVFIGVLALNWTMAYLSGSRSFFLAMLGSIVLTGWCIPLLWKRYTAWLLGTALIGLIFYVLLVLWLPNLLGSPDPETLASYSMKRDLTDPNGRFDIWIHALQEAWANPWLGVGPMMTAEVSFFKTEAHPHNYLIQWVTEWGIPFTLLLIGFLGYQLWQWRQTIREVPQQRAPLALPVTASIGAAGVAGLFDGLLVMPVSLAYLVLIVGIAVRLQHTWTPHKPRIHLSPIASILLLLPTLTLAGFTLYQIPNVLESPFVGKVTPRFWANGTIKLTSPFSKTYSMGGASNSYKQVALRLATTLFPHIKETQCQMYMGGEAIHPPTATRPSQPDLSIRCPQQYEYIVIDLKPPHLTVHTWSLMTQQWSSTTWGMEDKLTLTSVPQPLPLTNLFTPEPPTRPNNQ
jgi:O-antigen ligase